EKLPPYLLIPVSCGCGNGASIISNSRRFCNCFSPQKELVREFARRERTGKFDKNRRAVGKRRGGMDYLPSSLSAAASSQAPRKDSISPASTRAANSGSTGISA